MITIAQVLKNAEINLETFCRLETFCGLKVQDHPILRIALDQLKNANALLEQGKSIDDMFDPTQILIPNRRENKCGCLGILYAGKEGVNDSIVWCDEYQGEELLGDANDYIAAGAIKD